jgi:uncharacterized membrane protein
LSYPIAVFVGALIFAAAGAWQTALIAIVLGLVAVYVGDETGGGADE